MRNVSQIKDLIRKGNVKGALDQLIEINNLNQLNYSNEIELLISRYNKKEYNIINNLISKEDDSVEESNINFSILRIIERIERNEFKKESIFLQKKLASYKSLFKIAVLFSLLVITLFPTKFLRIDNNKDKELINLKNLKKEQLDHVTENINKKVKDECQEINERKSELDKMLGVNMHNSDDNITSSTKDQEIFSILKETANRVNLVKDEYDILHEKLVPAIEKRQDVLRDEIEKTSQFFTIEISP